MSALLLVQGALAATALNFASLGTAVATPQSANALGASLAVITKGATNTIEITLHPAAAFDAVNVEAGSGVASLSPPCAFSGVVPGGRYVCRVNVTHAAGEASLTVNVVGQRTVDATKPRTVEVSHFTIANDAFVAPAAGRTPRMGPALNRTPDPRTAK